MTTPESAGASSHSGSLTERDLAILDFEREWWQHPGGKDEAIRHSFGISPARYYQLLNCLIDLRQALEYDPMLVKRLLRTREERRFSRERRLGIRPHNDETATP